MDLRQYFKKLREVETTIGDEFPYVVSLETSDGGKAGVVCEVSREQAAKMIVDRRGVLADDSQKDCHLKIQAARRKAAEKAEMAKRLQVAIISELNASRPAGTFGCDFNGRREVGSLWRCLPTQILLA